MSLVHCTDKYPVLFNDGSCRSSKIICQKPSNKIKFFSRNVSFKLLSINKSGINGKKMKEICPFKLNHSALKEKNNSFEEDKYNKKNERKNSIKVVLNLLSTI